MPAGEARTATRLGSYEILHMFARGGMAELYLARSVGPEGFEKLVVLKKILPSFAQNAKFVRLFLNEAKLAASLDHPSIAHVYDLGLVDNNYFFTMEYVHGQDVRSILQRSTRQGKLPIEHVVHVARSTASALHYAHERRGSDGVLLGIVHRDVSPSNIFVSYDGAVKLLDFGVAKAASSTVKTRTGALKGKVSYMSPEQAKGATIDRRSDIFSTGIVMWEMVATKRLFKAENDLATLQLVLHQPPPPLTELRPDCPKELERIIQKALAQDPEQRYQSAQELQQDLDQLAVETKLNQSSIALGTHMGVLFASEIAAWKAAQARGVSLADHIVEIAAVPVPIATGSSPLPFDESDEDEDDEAPPVFHPSVEADNERTEQTAPPVAVEAPPLQAPVEPVVPAPARKRRRKVKEPKGWETEPSIVVDDTLIETAPPAPAPPILPETPPPERQSRRDLNAALDTQLVSVVAPPASRRRTWVIAGAAVGVAAVAALVFALVRPSGDAAAAQPPAPAPEATVPEAPPPAPAIATPDPVPVKPVAEPPIAPPHKPARVREVAKPPIRHIARPAPKKPDKAKFDPDAPLPRCDHAIDHHPPLPRDRRARATRQAQAGGAAAPRREPQGLRDEGLRHRAARAQSRARRRSCSGAPVHEGTDAASRGQVHARDRQLQALPRAEAHGRTDHRREDGHRDVREDPRRREAEAARAKARKRNPRRSRSPRPT